MAYGVGYPPPAPQVKDRSTLVLQPTTADDGVEAPRESNPDIHHAAAMQHTADCSPAAPIEVK